MSDQGPPLDSCTELNHDAVENGSRKRQSQTRVHSSTDISEPPEVVADGSSVSEPPEVVADGSSVSSAAQRFQGKTANSRRKRKSMVASVETAPCLKFPALSADHSVRSAPSAQGEPALVSAEARCTIEDSDGSETHNLPSHLQADEKIAESPTASSEAGSEQALSGGMVEPTRELTPPLVGSPSSGSPLQQAATKRTETSNALVTPLSPVTAAVAAPQTMTPMAEIDSAMETIALLRSDLLSARTPVPVFAVAEGVNSSTSASIPAAPAALPIHALSRNAPAEPEASHLPVPTIPPMATVLSEPSSRSAQTPILNESVFHSAGTVTNRIASVVLQCFARCC